MHNKIHNNHIYTLFIKIINFLKIYIYIYILSLYNIKMTSRVITLIRKEYDLIAKNRGIKEPQKMSTEELLDTLSRYDSKREAESKIIKNKAKKNC